MEGKKSLGCLILLGVFFGLVFLGTILKHFEATPTKKPSQAQSFTDVHSPPPEEKPLTSADDVDTTRKQAHGRSRNRAAEEAGLRLRALESRGHIRLQIGDNLMLVEVEPTSWAAMRHQDKKRMCQLAKEFVTGLNQEGKQIDFVYFKDMTSRATLAEVCLRDGHIAIKQ